MNLKLVRNEFSAKNTLGKLYVNDVFYCDVLEDPDRGLHQLMDLSEIKEIKIKHDTAVPYGKYEIIISYSEKFGRSLPLLLNVLGFDGIRIHPGNTEADTSGCLLVGKKNGKRVINSRSTFNNLYKLLLATSKKEKIYIEITT